MRNKDGCRGLSYFHKGLCEYVCLSLASLGCFIRYQSEELHLLNVLYMLKVKENTRKEKCPVSILGEILKYPGI